MQALIIDVELAVVRDDGRYLMVVRGDAEEHAAGVLSFPGGGVEPTIQPDILEATAIRELAEETGLHVDGPEYVQSHSFALPDGTPVLVVLFIARCSGGVARVVDADEVAAVTWRSADEVCEAADTPLWMVDMMTKAERKRVALGW